MSIDRRETTNNINRLTPLRGGSFEDYTGEFPLEEYFGSNSINYASKGQRRNDLYVGGGDDQHSVDLPPQTPSEYPHNQVL